LTPVCLALCFALAAQPLPTLRTFYPPASVANDRGGERAPESGLLVDRSIVSVRNGTRPQTVVIAATEQRRRLTPAQTSEPAGRERHVVATCDLGVDPPRCR
jgi:hypothetical protein